MIYRFKKTFIGVGGREYISNPKLSFPEHVKIRRRGTNPRSGQPYTEAGSAFVETSAAACLRIIWIWPGLSACWE